MRRAERVRDWVPRWWRGEAGAAGALLSAALAPAELAFDAAVLARNAAYDRGVLSRQRAEIPVISIGNLAVGGAGKTPFSAFVARRLEAAGQAPALVLSGYASDEVEVHRELNPGIPVFAERRRAHGVAAAVRAGCGVAVLDDAFQHRALVRDLDIVLISAESWTSRAPRLLPRGPWRERPRALKRADVVVITRKAASEEAAAAVADRIGALPGAPPPARCHLRPGPLRTGSGELPLDWLRDRDVLAVATLADPRSFHDQLLQLGARPELRAFPDHHEFTAAEVDALLRRAAGRPLVATRKEAVKLRGMLPAETDLLVLDQQVEMEDGEAALDSAIRDALRAEGRR